MFSDDEVEDDALSLSSDSVDASPPPSSSAGGAAPGSGAQARQRRAALSVDGHSNKYLKLLYTADPADRRRITCNDCGQAGRELCVFALRHSMRAHSASEQHVRAVAAFPTRETKRKKIDREVAAKEEADVQIASAAQPKAKASSLSGSTLAVSRSSSSATTSQSRSAANSSTGMDRWLVPAGDDADTRTKLLRAMAAFIVMERMSLATVTRMGPLLNSAINHGRRSGFVTIEVPGQADFVAQWIEGAQGLLGRGVAEVIDTRSKFMLAGKYGFGLKLDSARDANSRSVMPILLDSTAGLVLVAMPRPDGQSKTGAWIAGEVIKVLDKCVDVAEQETARSSTARPLAATASAQQINKLANAFGNRVFFCSSDHASAELAAMASVQRTHAVLPSGDPSHALHNCGKALVKPFSDFVKKVHDTATFFRAHSLPKEWLRAACEDHDLSFGTLINNIETRFLSIFIMTERFLKCLAVLKDVVSVQKWRAWAANGEHTDDAHAAEDFIKDEDTELGCKFIIKLLLHIVKACRFFDSARVGSMSFVYPIWSLLTESVRAAIADPEMASIVTPDVHREICDTLIDCWRRFDFDIYGASCVLNPYFHSEITALNTARVQTATTDDGDDLLASPATPEASEYHDLVEQTMRVLLNMVRRFPFGIDAPARKTIISPDDARLAQVETELRKELTQYLSDSSRAVTWEVDKPNVLPGALWEAAPPESRLRGFAMMLVSAVSGSTAVERMHHRAGQTRTDQRNATGYVRNQAYLFLDQMLNTPDVSPTDDLAANMAFLREFKVLTDQDVKFLEEMDARLAEADLLAAEQAQDAADAAAALEAEGAAPAQAEQAEERGRGRRKVSSRFVAALEAEKRAYEAQSGGARRRGRRDDEDDEE